MKAILVVFTLIALGLAAPASAHRLDEYLQATTFSIQADALALELRMTPGTQVFTQVMAAIDTDGDGVITPAEQSAYAENVRRDLSLTVDSQPVPILLTGAEFPPVEEMRQGLGEICLRLTAPMRPRASHRRITFLNRHQSAISVYLMNCLVPADGHIGITGQDRSYDQSFYQLDFTVANAAPAEHSSATAGWFDRSGAASLFAAYVYQGIHHILTGYDHLLFVSALVLAANSLWDVVKVVFTFTLAHSLTLSLAAMNLIHVSSRVVEPMISASIVFVAIQNIFWPRTAGGAARLAVAFFFGLFHGLGFAGGLLDAMRQMPGTTMFLSIVAFSIGVEAGHQMVVLPLFGLTRLVRQKRPIGSTRAGMPLAIQRAGSAAISLAGTYYLCLSLNFL